MDRYAPPPKPDDFDEKVKRYKDAVQAAIDQDEKPEFEAQWGRFKTLLSEASRGKCGFCELFVSAGQNGDVEHFHPKSEIWQLLDDAADRGKEEDWSAKVKDRKRDVVAERGYWWLAYEWSNYLLSCLVCNQKWKLAYFPVEDEVNRTLPPDPNKPDTPLLLNPFHGPNPRGHLAFGRDGEVAAYQDSKFGGATIDVCGLDRVNLRRARKQQAKRAHKLVRDLLEAQTDEDFMEAAEELYELGDPDYQFCGLPKAVFEQATGKPWSDLEKIVKGAHDDCR